MKHCQACAASNLDQANFCEQCGNRFVAAEIQPAETPPVKSEVSAAEYVQPITEPSIPVSESLDELSPRFEFASNSTVADATPVEAIAEKPNEILKSNKGAVLVVERGDKTGAEFQIKGDESTIGRWDADNGVFPDIDLDHFDTDAKVSRRHARIKLSDGKYYIEDLGSTNGTYVNRGRRLLPGNIHELSDGDEVIVGKTFLRFKVLV